MVFSDVVMLSVEIEFKGDGAVGDGVEKTERNLNTKLISGSFFCQRATLSSQSSVDSLPLSKMATGIIITGFSARIKSPGSQNNFVATW